jgi:transcription elongation factor Elf1
VNHRIVSTLVVVIVALFAVAAAAFTWTASATAPLTGAAAAPGNPHPPARRTESCMECHSAELGTIPATHRNFSLKTCESCHQTIEAVRVPHSVAMGDSRCPLCHGEPARDFGMPAGHLQYKTEECLLCHPVSADNYDKEPEPAGLSKSPANVTPHVLDGVFEDCDYCHHTELQSTLPESHKDFALDTCDECHGAEDSGAGAGD